MEIALDNPTRLRVVPSHAESEAIPPEQATDADLLVRIAHRDRQAFDVVYHRYIRSVFGLALHRLRDRERAEDAVQEMFAAVWRSAASYDPERGPAAPWLYAIARNAIVDRVRTRDELPMDPPEIAADEPGPAERAESAFVSWRVHRALETLPEREREVVELAYWSGLSQSEVASFLDIPLGTVKTRTRSALAHLADVLEGELE
ncbi:MAG: sigma-70 family RNA polymerase sigma factor [Acidobacteriota bacterium]|nr:sigma-70 family RNA polymerase sigma factor [Acidobacteriota bacterium]